MSVSGSSARRPPGEPLEEAAWVLAGGLGTRLRAAVADVPKVLAPIDGRPFLDIVLAQLYREGFRRVVLLTGYLSEQIEAFVARRASPPDLSVAISRETFPLGTGGALSLAREHAQGRFFLLNGDTFFDVDAHGLREVHLASEATVTIGGTRVLDGARYGSLEVDSSGLVRSFREKDASAGPALINAGVYVLEPSVVASLPTGVKTSLEADVLPRLIKAGTRVAVAPQDADFFDIGTPESYAAFAAFARQRFA